MTADVSGLNAGDRPDTVEEPRRAWTVALPPHAEPPGYR
jgi:hypothetical protein